LSIIVPTSWRCSLKTLREQLEKVAADYEPLAAEIEHGPSELRDINPPAGPEAAAFFGDAAKINPPATVIVYMHLMGSVMPTAAAADPILKRFCAAPDEMYTTGSNG
jgi:hypothetical protein